MEHDWGVVRVAAPMPAGRWQLVVLHQQWVASWAVEYRHLGRRFTRVVERLAAAGLH